MASSVYDLFDAKGKRRLGVVWPSRAERKADYIKFGERYFRAQRDQFGQLIDYREVPEDEIDGATLRRGSQLIPKPRGVKYGSRDE